MAWYKPAWRQRLGIRRLRFAATRGLAALAPGLARRFHFYGRARALDEAAVRPLLDDRLTIEAPLTPEQAAFVERRCGRFDGGRAPGYWRAPWAFRREYFLFEDALFLGHTGRLVDAERRALLIGWGEAENWNRDRLTRLRAGRPAEGVVLPVRAFNNYFHFLFEAALPLVAYLESAERAAAPSAHEILAVGAGRKRFAVETLEAIAAAYGCGLRWVGAREAVACRSAVFWRLESPAADWFPARRASAERLAEILLAAAPTAPAEVGAGLFLERGREKIRNLTNAAELRAALEGAGLTAFAPSGKSLAEQAAALRGARTVVAVHGAALANLLWAQPGATVIELQSEGAEKSVYLALCHQMGLRHRAVIGPPGDARQDFAAPIEAVITALAEERGGGAQRRT